MMAAWMMDPRLAALHYTLLGPFVHLPAMGCDVTLVLRRAFRWRVTENRAADIAAALLLSIPVFGRVRAVLVP